MVHTHHKHKSAAEAHARHKRAKGYIASVYPKTKGWGCSVTRK